MKLPTTGGVNGCGSCPTIRTRIIFAARVHCKTAVIDPAPDDHFAAGPHRCVIGSASGRVSRIGGCPTVRVGIISASAVIDPAPDDHFIAGPHRCVTRSGSRCVNGGGGCPTICPGIISPAGIVDEVAAPDDHLAAGPHRRVTGSASGCVHSGRSRPAVYPGIVSPTGVQIAGARNKGIPAPDDHFTASPHRGVTLAAKWRAISSRPGIIISASARCYCWQCVASSRHCYRSRRMIFRSDTP